MACDEHENDAMRYVDNEMTSRERAEFEGHLASCEECRTMLDDMLALKEVTDSMKIADLPETVWDTYWTKVYNRLERSVAWFVFISGALILFCYSVYQVLIDPGMDSIVRLGVVMTLVGLAILFLSVLREKRTVNRRDRYISEVDR